MMELIGNKNNPFRQSKNLWLLEFDTKFSELSHFSDILDEIADSSTCFEKDASPKFESEPDDIWSLNFYFTEKPIEKEIENIINQIIKKHNLLPISFTITKVEDKDWVSEVQKNFPPFAAGRFFIHGSHYNATSPISLIPIEIDASRAFGTGEHETTYGCLNALSELAKKYNFETMLDVGTGSGILAIAMAKLWKNRILASDIDSEAVKIAYSNTKLNKVSNFIDCFQSEGYKSLKIRENKPYDLIAANILAKPLIKLSKDLALNLKEGGIAILSGFLDYQARSVLSAHERCGLKLVKSTSINNWVTMILSK